MSCLSILVPQLQHRAPSPSELLPPHLVVKKLCHGHTHTFHLSTGRLTQGRSLEVVSLPPRLVHSPSGLAILARDFS